MKMEPHPIVADRSLPQQDATEEQALAEEPTPQQATDRPDDDRAPRDEREAEGESSTSTREPLLEADEGNDFQARWQSIQIAFVDEPRAAVSQADALVAELLERLTTMFDEERRSLESRWEGGNDVSTEDLRVALQRYRSFFDRLLIA